MRALYICGTDTDAGKSVVTAGLLAGIKGARAIKIVQTGPQLLDQSLYLQAAPTSSVKTLRHYGFPASPHLAAKMEGRPLDLHKLALEIKRETASPGLTLLEGSGGLLSPLTEEQTFLDLMVQIPFPIILTVRNALGAINQTLLSLEALSRRNLKVAGLIFTQTTPSPPGADLILNDNINIIQSLGRAPILAVLPFIAKLSSDKILTTPNAWTKITRHLEPAISTITAS